MSLTIFIGVLVQYLGFGQKDEIVDHQLWLDVIPHFEINIRLEYFGDSPVMVYKRKDFTIFLSEG